MVESMVERVAAVIAMKSEGWTKNAKDYIPHARAAIEAMREPTDAMVEGGAVVVSNQDADHDKPLPTLSNAYRAIIDAALNERVSG